MSYRFSIVTCLVSLGMSAQSYVGFLSDNYSGVHGILNNPSSIADSRYKLDVNLAGVSTTLGTDLFSFKLNDLASNQFDFSENLTVSNNNNVFSNIDVLGPSLLINLSPKDAIALSTRTRAYLNGYDIDGTTYNLVETSFENEEDFGPIMSNGLNFALNSWAELGFSYARVVVDKEEHFLKAGATIKYLQGIANGYVHLGNLTLGYNTDLNEVVTGGTAVIGASGDIDDITQVAEVFENFDYNTVSQFTGIGLDIGATYEWRPRYADYKYTNSEGEEIYYNNKNKYKVKIGVAITDIGSINYTGINRPYDLGEVLSPEDFEDIEDLNSFEEFFLLGAGAPTEIEASNLPTMFHLNTDWNINNKSLYLNFNADLSTAVSGLNRIRNVNMLTVTPRFERKWFTVQLPVSLQQYTGVQAGFGFRAGPLYLGSGTILTNAFNNASNSFDVYAGLKLPIYQGRPKDTDGDGIDDKQDKCPTEVGPVENGGCPWSDVDKDGVNDALDACPNTAGAIDNRGCPLPDQDEDGIPDRDDSCPDLAGKPEDNGCPDTDTDGDGLVDKEDNCPKIVGAKR